MDFTFDLSQGLFSSADVDAGTRQLLKVFSQVLDDAEEPPRRILDAGCGTGVIGICAAAAVSRMVKDGGVLVRCQDRDELARLITVHNAAQNGIPPAMLEARTGPLLGGQGRGGEMWDMILTNIPAKAGMPVLEDFVRRSAGLLSPGGRVIMVAVHTLADFFRKAIAAEAELLLEHKSAGHCVFVYGKTANAVQAAAVSEGAGFLSLYPFYFRAAPCCSMEDIPICLETVHGASGFDNPGGTALAAARLIRRLGPRFAIDSGSPILIHEPGQGFFPRWLIEFLRGAAMQPQEPPVLSGRNILALEASRHNMAHHNMGYHTAAITVPAVDLQLGQAALLEAASGRQYGCIAAFPELLPQKTLPKGANQLAALWDALPPLLGSNGMFVAAFSSTDAERFERKKPAGFASLGSIKRNGFRALGYAKT